jgi:hypothetical protein
MEAKNLKCPICRREFVSDQAIDDQTTEKIECPISLETDRAKIFPCGHKIGVTSFPKFVAMCGTDRSRTALSPRPNTTLPYRHPRWEIEWSIPLYPEFLLDGHRVMWVMNAFNYSGITLVDVVMENLWWGWETPPPPPPLSFSYIRRGSGEVRWINSERRWRFCFQRDVTEEDNAVADQ